MTFNDQFTPEENSVIQELRNDPRPTVKKEIRESIRQEVFMEMDKVFPASVPTQTPHPTIPLIGVAMAVVVVIIVIVIAVILSAASKQELPAFTPTAPSVIVTASPAPSVDTATAQPTLEATQTPAIESSSTASAIPSTQTDDTIITIEGPIEQINGNIITIFSINIQVDANDPILSQIQIGDNLHVEGYAVSQGDTVIIIAIQLTIINPTSVNPVVGATELPLNCKITPKGHIKCTKKK